MSMELKIFIWWIVLTIITWLIARIQYYVSSTNLYWKYWREDSVFGVLYFFISRVGFWLFILYYLVVISSWWFKR